MGRCGHSGSLRFREEAPRETNVGRPSEGRLGRGPAAHRAGLRSSGSSRNLRTHRSGSEGPRGSALSKRPAQGRGSPRPCPRPPALDSRKRGHVPHGVWAPGLVAARTRVGGTGWQPQERTGARGSGPAREAVRPLAGGVRAGGLGFPRTLCLCTASPKASSFPGRQGPRPAHPGAMNSEHGAGRSHGNDPPPNSS